MKKIAIGFIAGFVFSATLKAFAGDDLFLSGVEIGLIQISKKIDFTNSILVQIHSRLSEIESKGGNIRQKERK